MSKKRPRHRPAVGPSLQQAMLDNLAEARHALQQSKPPAVRIHDFRKSMKRFRALMRLLAPALGEQAKHIRLQARDMARELAGSRDSQAALDAVRDLGKHGVLAERSAKKIGGHIAKLKKSSEQTHLTDELKLRLLTWIDSMEASARLWPSIPPDSPALAKSIAAHYRRARRSIPDAWSAATPDDIHEFRQRVIAYRYQLEMVEPLRPKLVRKWINAAQRLRTRLGHYQDLNVLADLSMPGKSLALWRTQLEKKAAQRREEHLAAAARSAEKIFDDSAKSFRKRIESLQAEATA